MKTLAKIILTALFPLAIPIVFLYWIGSDGESLPDLIRAYFDNVEML